jgi:hypothetical protein
MLKIKKAAKAASKPNSVSCTGYPKQDNDHSSRVPVARHLTQPTRELRRAALNVPLFGLAPGGVYKASPVTRETGALLPHLFTLTGHFCQAVFFLLHFPSRCRDSTLWSTLPCGVRTFLRIIKNDSAIVLSTTAAFF